MNFEVFRTAQTQFPWLITACFAVLGLLIGSFLNVCIYRIPKGHSIVHPGSHCACGKPIPWYRNIPLFSWFALRGKAPCCGRHFSFRYPLVETLTGTLFALFWHTLPWQQAIPGIVLCAFLIVLSFIDLDTMFLPDSLNASLAFLGLLFSLLFPELHNQPNAPDTALNATWEWTLPAALNSSVNSLIGMMLGAGLIYWVRFTASWLTGREAMGEGDVILCGGIGAFCGWQGALFSLLGGAFFGCIILLPILLITHHKAQNPSRQNELRRAASLASLENGDQALTEQETLGSIEIPFGPWLAIGAISWFLYFRSPMSDYITNIAHLWNSSLTQ